MIANLQATFLSRVYDAMRDLPHGLAPTGKHLLVARALAFWQAPTMPTHEQLARAAGVHRNTVGAAMRRFYSLGLLDWTIRAARDGSGRMRRIANRYHFPSNLLPKRRALPAFRKTKKDLIFPCGTNIVQSGPRDPSLDVIAARMTAKLAQRWQAGR